MEGMNDTKQTICEFGESIVSYLYDELPLLERARFEDHLPDCTSCTDDFAGVANARYEVYEWTKVFAEVPTPQFTVPYDEPVTLVEKVRHAFRFNWGWPAAGAFASIALVAVLGYLVFIPNDSELAGVGPVADNTPDVTVVAIEPPQADAPDVVPTLEREASKTKVQPVPIKATRPAAKPAPVVPRQTRFATNDRRAVISPRLTEFADDTDDSLRLAELFEDVESSE